MVIIEKTEESDVYIFHSGTEDEFRLEWKQIDDNLPRKSPPFMLEGDILSYVNETESIMSITQGDDLEKVEMRYRGLNNVLARIVEENEGYMWDVEMKRNEIGDLVDDECGNILGKGGICSSDWETLETLLPTIINLVDCKYGYTMIYNDVFHVSNWWLQEYNYGLFPGVVVLYALWGRLNKYVEDTYHLFNTIGHKVYDVTPAFLNYRMKTRLDNGKATIKSELNHPVYTVTGIRYQLGKNLPDDEKTAAAELFLAKLKVGQKVVLVAEPDNPADAKAIAAYIDYKRIGYIVHENIDEVSKLLDGNGQCDAVVERTDGHVTFFISIPGAPDETSQTIERPRLLPDSPLGENVRLPYSSDENTLQLLATRLIKMEISKDNLHEIIQLATRYLPFRMLSICYDDTLWRDKISKILYRILSGSCLLLSLKEKEREKVENIYVMVSRAIGDMRSTKEPWAGQVFVEHLNRLRNDKSINRYLYEKYCDEFLDGRDFADADKESVTKEYNRLCAWLKDMKWKQMRNPEDLQAMGKKVNSLGLSRQELYDLYSVLLIIEKLKEVMPLSDNKADAASYFSQEKYEQLSASRRNILSQLMSLIDKGDWARGITPGDIKKMLTLLLGLGEKDLTGNMGRLSEKTWLLFEKGRKGNQGRVKIIWQNMVGFLDDNHLLVQKGSPALNKDFFGDAKAYTNIDKGRPDNEGMSNGFREILPLLQKFVPILPKKK